ncbi:ATP-binding protein [Streptomyces hydrogenans]
MSPCRAPLAAAILDCLVHRCDVVSINGPSYRRESLLLVLKREPVA